MTAVTDARTGAETDFALLLSQLQEQGRTGTLKLSGPDGQVKYVYFKRGTIELLKTNRSRTLLGKALLKQRKLTEEQLQSALERQRAASAKLRLGEILVGMGIVLESDVHRALAYQIAEEVFEMFGWPRLRSEFYRGEPPLDIFESEDLQARVSLSPVQLSREAVRRQNELEEIHRALPSQRDVVALGPQAYARAESEQNPAVQEVVSTVDGQGSLAEVLDRVRAPDLVALRVLSKMIHEGEAHTLPANELVKLGAELERRGEFERARERFLRAEELGHADFDLPCRIGQLSEALGDVPDACRRYVVYAERCAQQGYPDVATATLQRVIDLQPGDLEARERLAELLARSARTLAEAGDPAAAGRALEAGQHYEQLLSQTAAPPEQRRVLGALVALLPDRVDLRERMAQVSLALGDPGQAVQDLQDLAIHALEAGDLARATATLEKILEIDPDDLLALQSLATTYARMGRTADAVREFLRLARTLEESGLATASADRMVEIYEKVVDLEPGNTEARAFLARAYDDKKEADKAVAHYASIADALRRKGDDAELLATLDKLITLRPTDQALALERAGLLRTLGRGGEALEAMRAMAEAAARQGDAATAQKAWSEVLAQVPGDLDAHLALARLEEKNREHAAAARRLAAVFELALVAGKDDLAEEAVKRALDLEPDRPEHRERLARILALRGRKDEAARTLVRAARRARDDENVGTAQAWARRALELDGTCDDARDLLEALKRPPVAAAPAPEEQRPVIHATITGGAPSMSIDSFKTKTRKIGGIAERLRNMAGGGGPATPAPPAAPDGEQKVAKGPEAPGEAADPSLSRKASSAMSRLKALKSGGSEPAALPLDDAPPPPLSTPVSKGPEGPGEAVDVGVPPEQAGGPLLRTPSEGGGVHDPQRGSATKLAEAGHTGALAKKASSAMNRLKALKAGGGSEPAAPPLPAQQVSKGPEAPGDAVDEGLAKKASSAMNRLRALKAGGGAPPPEAAPPAQPISKGPEAPGDAVDEGVAKKASSAMNRLKALKAGGGAPPPPEAAPPAQQVSKGPEGPGEAVDEGLAKKASSAMNRLKALKAGGGAPPAPEAAPPAQQVSKGPEAPGDVVDLGLAKKASSAMSRLKALKAGGGGASPSEAPAPAAGQTISKGPEAPGDAVDQGLAKKASSAMSRLKALKAGGSAPPPPPAPDGGPAAGVQADEDDASGEGQAFESTVA
ncbi:MAG: tetratricopeptide repeat protein [Planctomycetes bacterium]|nr:tetratricopeptide repeat protein [Planctomycetota bacterium]